MMRGTPADNHGNFCMAELAVGAHAVGNLGRQFAGRRQDKCAAAFLRRAFTAIGKLVKQR